MKKFISILIILCMLLTVLAGCNENKTSSENNAVSNNNLINSSGVETVDNTTIFNQFVAGEITAKTKENTFLYINQFEFLEKGFSYTCYDVDYDNEKELCVKNIQLYIFDIKDGTVYNLYTETRANSTVLNDGALFQVQHGAEPDHIYYDYRKINQNGEIEIQNYFSWWDAATADDDESYYIGEKRVTKQDYDNFWAEYSNFADDKVIWSEVEGIENTKTDADTPNTQTEYKNIYEELDATIEAEYEEALNNALSTADICDVHIEFESRWKAIADEYYNKLIKDESLKPYIIELKADWEVYYDSQIENYRNIYGKVLEGGSLSGIVFSSKKCSLQKDWALQLINIYTL